MLLCTTKEAYLEQTAINHYQCTQVSSVLQFAYTVCKIFRQSIKIGLNLLAYECETPHFHSKKLFYPGSLEGKLRCFSAVSHSYSCLHYVLTNSLHPYIKPARVTHLKPKFTSLYCKFNTGSMQPLSSAYRLLLAQKVLLTWMRKDKHTYTYTCKHENIHTLFRKQYQ